MKYRLIILAAIAAAGLSCTKEISPNHSAESDVLASKLIDNGSSDAIQGELLVKFDASTAEAIFRSLIIFS